MKLTFCRLIKEIEGQRLLCDTAECETCLLLDKYIEDKYGGRVDYLCSGCVEQRRSTGFYSTGKCDLCHQQVMILHICL